MSKPPWESVLFCLKEMWELLAHRVLRPEEREEMALWGKRGESRGAHIDVGGFELIFLERLACPPQPLRRQWAPAV